MTFTVNTLSLAAQQGTPTYEYEQLWEIVLIRTDGNPQGQGHAVFDIPGRKTIILREMVPPGETFVGIRAAGRG